MGSGYVAFIVTATGKATLTDGTNHNEAEDRSDQPGDRLARTVLNSLSANIAILDRQGTILETNRAWGHFARQNQMAGPHDSVGSNYLAICDHTRGEESEVALQVAAGIRAVINGDTREFMLDYPCHSPTEEHWYYVRAIRVAGDDPIRVVVSHEEITALKQAERALRVRERERDRLRLALELAMEVQQALLPRKTPIFPGIDLAGRSIYCDETGGDYYDFFRFDPADSKALGVVIGDVSGHGVSSALLMAAVRASLRQRAAMPGGLSNILGDVNRLLSRDLVASDQFITLFFVGLAPDAERVTWVRAGHEPGLLYHASEGSFEWLKGDGVAMGLDESAVFAENESANLASGDILVLVTDGIGEARNHSGIMFGKQRLQEQVRQHADRSATFIRDAILDDVRAFIAPAEIEDDMTLVVVKIL